MNRNLPQKNNESLLHKFFGKLIEIWKRIKKCTKNEMEYDGNISNSGSETKESENLDYLKFDGDINNTDFKRRKFLNELIDHPEMLEEFSEDRLEKILQWYIAENKRGDELLKKKGILN